jgi:tRNA pseudouridine38-40 synthase
VALAGRTDAGVHARGQVGAFVTASRHSTLTFARGTNALLPKDVCVRAVAEAAEGFDPRRQARSRWYRYTLHLGRERPALLRHFVWHPLATVDLDAMASAARCLVGVHDFAAFTHPSEAKRRRTERLLTRAQLMRKGELALLDIEGNAFLPQMIRRIAGTLVEVGSGKRTAAQFEALIKDAQPGEANQVAPGRGLCLMKVRYEDGLFDDETNEDI